MNTKIATNNLMTFSIEVMPRTAKKLMTSEGYYQKKQLFM